MEHQVYLSERGLPLLWMGKCDEPVVTLENYEKWYSAYVVHPNGKVEKIDGGLLGVGS